MPAFRPGRKKKTPCTMLSRSLRKHGRKPTSTLGRPVQALLGRGIHQGERASSRPILSTNPYPAASTRALDNPETKTIYLGATADSLIRADPSRSARAILLFNCLGGLAEIRTNARSVAKSNCNSDRSTRCS
jgi:hypothetical protein